MTDYVTIETGYDGSIVMVEPKLQKGLTRRVFRRMANGYLEWASYADWQANNERARFYGYSSKELPETMVNP